MVQELASVYQEMLRNRHPKPAVWFSPRPFVSCAHPHAMFFNDLLYGFDFSRWWVVIRLFRSFPTAVMEPEVTSITSIPKVCRFRPSQPASLLSILLLSSS